MIKKTRFDGTLVRDIPAFTRLMPYLMPDKKGSIIFFEQELDVTETFAYMKKVNRELIKEREILTLFEVVLCATVRAIAFRPRLNRFISGYRYWQRNQILLNFVAKKEITDEGKEVNVKIPFEPDVTLRDVARITRRHVRAAISEGGVENEKVVNGLMHLPHGLLKFVIRAMSWLDQRNLMLPSFVESDPMWASVFLANVGSFGLDAPYHHLFERGNCPIFMAVGKVHVEQRLDAEGRPAERKFLTIRYSFDDRIADGVYMGKTLDLARTLIEHPEQLDRPPELSPELLAELRLKSQEKGK
jgi:hypothetical protein